jgi:hypothetical protein
MIRKTLQPVRADHNTSRTGIRINTFRSRLFVETEKPGDQTGRSLAVTR